VSATTATALPSTASTWRTPGMDRTFAASNESSLPPGTGQAWIVAVEHARQLDVRAVDARAGQFLDLVSRRLSGLADRSSNRLRA
jgi:hypothetical protein